ncbi:unnamed protein product [Dovyalis caffra]|uniref:Uncharacterized protein n=1 Tax=Dovyalis caffra TaxID=77055 RepID=A0AAV1R3Z2_9ROSI|nr:unnamed protein product [Dovyalis caffra]
MEGRGWPIPSSGLTHSPPREEKKLAHLTVLSGDSLNGPSFNPGTRVSGARLEPLREAGRGASEESDTAGGPKLGGFRSSIGVGCDVLGSRESTRPDGRGPSTKSIGCVNELLVEIQAIVDRQSGPGP